MKKSKVAIYARVSTNNGTQDYQRQINDLTKLILSKGYDKEQIEIFAEKISGYKKNTERPELTRMLNLINEDSQIFQMIFVTEVSRFGRNPSETRTTIDMLTELKVPIYIQSLEMSTLSKEGKRNSLLNIILQVLMELADAEAETIKNRSISGLRNSVIAGKAGGSRHLPYGYRKDENKMLVVDEEEAEVIKEIFRLYKAGNGAKVINGILNDRNIPTRYNKAYKGRKINFTIKKDADKIKWSDKTVLDILSNTLYKGQRVFREQIYKAPAIISEELFDECTKIRLGKTHRNYETKYTYLLKDIIKCGCCGRNMFGRFKPTDKGDKVYICSSRLIKGGGCGNKGINIMQLETALFHQLVLSDTVLKYISNTQQLKLDLENDMANLTAKISSSKNIIAEKEVEKKRILNAYIAGVFETEDEFFKKNSTLVTELKNLNSKIDAMQVEFKAKRAMLSKQTEVGATRKMLEDAANNRTELEAIFKQIIHKVIVNDLSTRHSLASVQIKVDGVILPKSLKVFIDKISIRRKQVKYLATDSISQPYYEDDILKEDKRVILEELENGFYENQWNIVNDLLYVSK